MEFTTATNQFQTMKIAKYLAAGLCLATFSGFTTSCGDDEPDPQDMATAKVKIEYDVEVSSDLLKYCDVQVYYLDADARPATETLTNTEFHKTFTYERNNAYHTYTLSMSATPKKSFPEYSESLNYNISYDLEIDMERYNSKNRLLGELEDKNEQSQNVSGRDLVDRLDYLSKTSPSVHLTFDGYDN